MSVTLLNLDTLDVIHADEDQLRDRGIPTGYVIADDFSTYEWLALIKQLQADKKFLAGELSRPRSTQRF